MAVPAWASRYCHPATVAALLVLTVLAVWMTALVSSVPGGSRMAAGEWSALRSSLGIGMELAATTAGVSAVLAYPLARYVPVPWLVGLALVSSVARAYGILALDLAPGFWAASLALASEGVPLMALLLALALRGRPLAWLDAAADLGARPWQRLWRIEWPACRGALALGAVWIGLRALGDAVVPEIAGGGFVYTPALVLRDAMGADAAPRRAAILVAALIATAAAVAWWATGRADASDLARTERSPRSGGRVGPALAGALALGCATAWLGLVQDLEWGWTGGDALLAGRLPTTLVLGLVVAVLAGLCGVAGAAPAAAPRAVMAIIFIPLALPPSVVGQLALSAWRSWGGTPGSVLTVMALAPTGLALGFACGWLLRGRRGARLVEAAADLGAGPVARFVRIRLPLAGPAAVAAALLTLAWVVADRSITSYTTAPGQGTIAVALATVVHGGQWSVAVRWALGLAIAPLFCAAVAIRVGGGRPT